MTLTNEVKKHAEFSLSCLCRKSDLNLQTQQQIRNSGLTEKQLSSSDLVLRGNNMFQSLLLSQITVGDIQNALVSSVICKIVLLCKFTYMDTMQMFSSADGAEMRLNWKIFHSNTLSQKITSLGGQANNKSALPLWLTCHSPYIAAAGRLEGVHNFRAYFSQLGFMNCCPCFSLSDLLNGCI